MIELAKMTLSA